MFKKVSVLISDDSVLFAQGLSLLLQQCPDVVSSIALAHNYQQTLAVLQSTKIDILILDLNFENENFNGFTIAAKVKKNYPNVKIIILTQQAKIDNYEILFNEIDVSGYLDKQLGLETTLEAIQKVANGEKYIDDNIKKMLEIGKWLNISSREKEVIELLTEGYLQKEVADKLFISHRTVETHIKNLLKRMNAKNSAHLISIYLNYKNANRENTS
jgi:DNA-binding NarL/FixJ family response regulator